MVDEKTTIQWDRAFETGDAGIDAEHRRLFQLLQRLCDLQGQPGPDLLPILDALKRYTEEHFSHEAALMDEHDVSSAHRNAHRMAHQIFVSTIDEATRTAHHDPAAISAELLSYLGRWLLTHVMGMDRDLVQEIHRSRSTRNA